MPWKTKKNPKGGYDILKKEGGKWKKVGHSSSKAKADSSIRARRASKHGWKPKQ